MAHLNVLVTGAGAPGIMGTAFSLRNQLDYKLKIIGTDIRKEVVGNYFLDKTYAVPPPSDNFVKALLKICLREKIRVVVPQVTKELDWLAKNREKFQKHGISVLVSDHQALVQANNKYLSLKSCTDHGIDCTGKYSLIHSLKELKIVAKKLGYPKKSFVVKIPNASGMRGLRIIKSDYDEYEDFSKNKPNTGIISLERLIKIFDKKSFPELLITEYFPGEEYSVDILARRGEMMICVPRRRDIIRTGITFESTTVNQWEIVNHARRIVRTLNLDYIIGLQFKKDEGGQFRLLECNPRVQGTMVHSTLAGANVIYGAVKLAVEGSAGLKQSNVIWGSKLSRYWGAFSCNGKQIKKV